MKIVGFHSHTMSLRGSETALWDYANFNETALGNKSIICYPEKHETVGNPTFAKWQARFPLIPYQTKKELSGKLKENSVGVLYQIKPGPFDGFIVAGVKNCIHSMFLSDEFHGDAFVYVSRWASRVMTGKEDSYVPHFVPKLNSGQNLREKLGIPIQAKTFGRHGGWDTFNIPFVRQVVLEHARRHPEDHFVFLNTEPVRGTEDLENVHYLSATVSPEEKGAFLATCDAMLHARWHGETFGLAVGEFAVLGKPVITFGGSREQAHLDMLNGGGLVYRDTKDLRRILTEFLPREIKGTAYEEWSDAVRVMEIFKKRFLD